MISTLRFDTAGMIGCLYTEVINLRNLGRLEVTRATDIVFNDVSQKWETKSATTGEVLFADASRTVCLEWEHANMQPPN